MDEENRNSSDIEDWIKELLPDFAADMGIGGVTLPSCGLSSFNQQNKGIATMASSSNSNNNNTSSMWQHQQLDNQKMETSLSYMGPNFRQPQSLQNQVVDPASERLNIYQFPMQSNSYPSNLRQHRQVQASNQMSTMTNKSLERQSGLVPERAQPEFLRISPFLQARNHVTLADQMKPGNQAQTTRLGCGPSQAISDSSLQPQLTNSTDWMDHAYYKILQMKEMFSPDLLTLYKRSQELRQSANNVEALNKCEKIRLSVERVFNFLSISRADIARWRKEKLFETMNEVVKYTNQARASNANAQKQNQLIRGPNNGICLQNIVQFNNSQQQRQQQPNFGNRPNGLSSASHQFNPAQLNNNNFNNNNNNNNFFGQWDFKPQNSATAVSPTLNEQTMKRQRNNKQQVVQRKKAEEQNKPRRAAGGLINQRRPPLSAAAAGAISPQNSPQSSPGVDLKDFCKSATVSVSASSCAFPSPLTPLTPCSKLADFAKSPLSIDENCKISPNSANPPLLDTSQTRIGADAYQGAIDSGVNTESAEKQSSLEEKVDPVKRLVDAVTSMSPRSLNSAIQDIAAVVSLTDRIASNFLHEDSTKIVFQDLADDISKFRMQSAPEDQMEIETRFCERASAKRLKQEPNDVLFQEIKEINQRFMEVKVDVMSMDEVARIGCDDGILVQCSYVPVGPASQHMIHKLLLELIVPADYPSFSPTVSEKMSRGCGDSEEGKYMWTKAKLNFGIKLRNFPQPITVKQMARAWEASARDAFLEYAQQIGGGSFSSRYYGMKMSGPGYSLCC